jgi:hypothetical protein
MDAEPFLRNTLPRTPLTLSLSPSQLPIPRSVSPVLFRVTDFDLSMCFIIEYTHFSKCCSRLKGCLTQVILKGEVSLYH